MPDPSHLEYLRPLVTGIASLLESGADGVLDMNAIVLLGAGQWDERVVNGVIQPLSFTATYWWTEEDGTGQWWRTRGMATFGRPDISLRHVLAAQGPGQAHGLIRRLANELALGRILSDGETVGGLTFEVADAFDDPMFLNHRAEARWPSC